MADDLNFQLPPKGFQSYLDGILPLDQAVVAGAFATSMGQINKIQQVDLQRFSQVVYSLETNFGLPLTNGTDIPTDDFIVDAALTKVALGSGSYGTYTMSDFVGAMTGLPHNVKGIYDGIKQLETNTLKEIYQKLYLAVKWETATVSVTCTDDGFGNFTPSALTLVNQGGGYGREGAAAPTITLSNGGTGTCTIGTDPNNLATYGKVLTVTLTSAGSSAVSCPTATVSDPPGGGWPAMNSVVQGYIDAANNEIFAIQTVNDTNFQAARALNASWDISGTALKIEQRSRYIAIPPVPVPHDKWLSLYPTSLYVFVDSVPDFAQNTLPHMAAQSLEAIADYCSIGGQSMVGMMRQERNQKRLEEVGISLNNNISPSLSLQEQKVLLTSGTAPNAVEGIPSAAGNFTLPAWPNNTECEGPEIIPDPVAFYDPNAGALRPINQKTDGNVLTILDAPTTVAIGVGGIIPDTILPPVDALPLIIINPIVPTGTPNDIVTTNDDPPTTTTDGIGVSGIPGGITPTQNIGTNGINLYPSPIPPVLPPNLDGAYTSTTLGPARYNAGEAIDKVIECNCDCWVN